MLIRVKQFVAALTAKVTAADRNFIRKNLRAEEQSLFYGMNVPDQRHALSVAQTALQLAVDREDINRELLVKCALLHDIGKLRGDVSTWDKIVSVIAHNLAPRRAKSWGKYGRGGKLANLRHAFYTYYHHPERGAQLLATIGEDCSVVDIIRRHHEAPGSGEPAELDILRQADNLH